MHENCDLIVTFITRYQLISTLIVTFRANVDDTLCDIQASTLLDYFRERIR